MTLKLLKHHPIGLHINRDSVKSNLFLLLVPILVMTHARSKVQSAETVGTEYVVSAIHGSDKNEGSRQRPFLTIQKAADVMRAGDTCIVRTGTYRETVKVRRSGTPGKPIRFMATKGEKVTLDGTEPVQGNWRPYRDGIYQIDLAGQRVTQLFVDRKMMTEARWPNCTLEETWNRDRWAHATTGSRKDLMISKELPQTNVDWTGAVAMLNIGPQYNTYARVVTQHELGKDRFQYDLAHRMNDGRDSGPTWANDRFYLFGKLEALDAKGEWFHDVENGKLYLRCEDDRSPSEHKIEFKRRDLGFDLQQCQHVEISGFRFFGATFALRASHHCVIEDCRLLFPNFARLLNADSSAASTSVQGDHNTIRKVSIGFSNTLGLLVNGNHNLIDNCIVHDVNWAGSFSNAGITMTGSRKQLEEDQAVLDKNQNVLQNCTVYGVGNIGILFGRGKHVIKYNRVYDTGRACFDISAIHTGSPLSAGSVVHHNWVHDSTGLGIRGDDQSRRLTFHHNAIWNCRRGLIMKGNHNRCFNNTVLVDPRLPEAIGSIVISKGAEPKKWWTRYTILKEQNVDSLVFNNASYLIGARKNRDVPLPSGKGIFSNVTLPADLSTVFVNADSKALHNTAFDLRPKAGSILIDAGKKMEEITGPYLGAAPDVGAYEAGGKNWRAGANWQAEAVPWKMHIKLESH